MLIYCLSFYFYLTLFIFYIPHASFLVTFLLSRFVYM